MDVLKIRKHFVIAGMLALTSACSLDLTLTDLNPGGISGAVTLPSSMFSTSVQSCSPYISLYSLETGANLSTSALSGSGSFNLKVSDTVNQSLKDKSVRYQLVFDNCVKKYSRIVTGATLQNISLASDLMAQAINVAPFNGVSKTTISRDEIGGLITKLQDIEQSVSLLSLEDIYLEIKNSPALSSQFNAVFGFNIARVEDAPATMDTLNVATSYNEGATLNPTALASHWYSGYSKIYKWELDNIVLTQSTSPALNKLISANSQGLHELKLTVGRNNGFGQIDSTKPVITKTFDIQIANTILPTAPVLSMAGGAALTNSTNIQLQLNTGSALINCESASAYALTEDSILKPSNESSYDIHCTQTGLQSFPYTLITTSDGQKTLRLWAIDSSGAISSTPSILNVTLDRTPPALNFSPLSTSNFQGGAQTSLQYSVNDVNGIASLQLQISTDGTTFTTLQALDPNSTSYLWTIPTLDEIAVHLKLVAMDNAGNKTSVTSAAFAISSIAPNPPTLTLLSPSFSQSTSVSIANANCNKSATQIIFSESATTPLLSAPTWQSCSVGGTHNFTIPSSQGAHNIYAWLRDAAGNISSSASVTMTYDTVIPTINLTSLNAGVLKGGSTQNIQWSASDAGGLTANPIDLSYSLNGGASWTSITTSLTNTGTYSWAVPSVDSNNVKIKVTAADKAGGSASAISSSVLAIDSTPPSLTINSPTGAEIVAGAASLTVQWTASDANLASLPMSFDYSTDGTNWMPVASGLANSGSLNWTLPLLNSNTVKVRATAMDQVSLSTATVSANFTVDSTNPAVTLTSLNGGAVYLAGSTQNISWSATDTNIEASPISLDYSCDNGTTWVSIASSILNSASPYSWTLPSVDATCKIRVTAKDKAGNSGVAISTSSFDIDKTAPSVAITSPAAAAVIKGGSAISVNWTASDTHMAATPVSLSYSTDAGNTWVPIATSLLNSGTYLNWILPLQEGAIQLKVQAVDTVGNTGSAITTFTIDNTPPTISSIVINDGDTYAQTIVLGAKVSVADNNPGPLYIQLVQAPGSDCPAPGSSWVPWTNATTNIPFIIPPIDGTIKLCAWAKDTAGNISEISPSSGTLGINYSTIEYRKGTPPTVSGLNVTNTGTAVTITVNATDDAPFASSSVNLAYSIGGTKWFDTATGLDVSNPANMTWQSSGQPPWTFNVTAPTTNQIQYRIIVKDAASNTSMPVKSQILNEPRWSIYAGNIDIGDGLAGTSTRWYYHTRGRSFAVNPYNNDIYFNDINAGLRKYDAKTGLVSTFIPASSLNPTFGNSGTLNSSHTIIPTNMTQITFDKNNNMYLLIATTLNTGSNLYRFNLTDNTYKKILGGGNSSTTNVPSSLFIHSTALAIDDENSLYMFTYCQMYNGTTTPTSASLADSASQKRRLVKVTQDSNGNPTEVIHLAGDCSSSSTVPGSIAQNTGLTFNYGAYSTITVMEKGKYIYLGNTNGLNLKIINGTIYSTGQGTFRSYEYNPVDGYMYATTQNNIYKFIPKLDGSAEVVTKLTGTTSTGNCSADNIAAVDSCLVLDTGIGFSSSGNLLLADGVAENRPSYSRLRLLTTDNKVTTLFGTMPFNSGNDQLNRELISGMFKGIYYKKAGEPNSGTNEFPEGLYFTEAYGMVFGRIDPITNKPVTLWGNQNSLGSFSNSQTASKNLSMGSPYQYGSGYPLYFDSNGTPWLRSLHRLVNLNKDKVISIKTDYTTKAWGLWADGTAPANVGLSVQGGFNNFTAKGTNFFLIGDYYSSGQAPGVIITKISYLDFTNNTFYKLMGNAYTETLPAAVATAAGAPAVADVAAGSVVNTSLPTVCSSYSSAGVNGCYVYYESSTDRLYYSEGSRLRYISTPTITSSSSLYTAFQTSSGASVRNFIMSADKTKVWWLASSGKGLYCTTISGTAPSWCDDTTNYYSIGSFASVTPTANQMTWIDDTTLLISTGNGLILKFNTPTGP